MASFLEVAESALHFQEGLHARTSKVTAPLVAALQADYAPPGVIRAAQHLAGGLGYPARLGKFVKVLSVAVKHGYRPSTRTAREIKHVIRDAQASGKLAKAAKEHEDARLHARFWNRVGDIAMDVMKSPIFSAVIGIATSAIPGIGVALAPIAVAVQRGVTNMVDASMHGESVDAFGAISAVAEAGLSAASPAVADAVHQGLTTAEDVVSKAQQAAAFVQAHAHPELHASLTASRHMVVRAKLGDPHAKAKILFIAHMARRGHHASIVAFAHITAVIHGMHRGFIPQPTHSEHEAFGHLRHFHVLPDPAAYEPCFDLQPPAYVEDGPIDHDPDQIDDDLNDDGYGDAEEYEDESDYGDAVGNGFDLHGHKLPPLKGPAHKLPPLKGPNPLAALAKRPIGAAKFSLPKRPGSIATLAPKMVSAKLAPGANLHLRMPHKSQIHLRSLGVTPAQAMVLTRANEQGGKSMAVDAADRMGLPTEAAIHAAEGSTELEELASDSEYASQDDDYDEAGHGENDESWDPGEGQDPDAEGEGYGGYGWWPTEWPRDGSTYGWNADGEGE